HGGLDALHGLLDIGHHATAHAVALGLAHAEDLDLALFVPAPDDAGDLRGADVEARDDFLVLVHGVVVSGCCSLGANDLVGEAEVDALVATPIGTGHAFGVEKAQLVEALFQAGSHADEHALPTDLRHQLETGGPVHHH